MTLNAVRSDRCYPNLTGATLISVLRCEECGMSYNLLGTTAAQSEGERRAEQDPREIVVLLQAAIDAGHPDGHKDVLLRCDGLGRVYRPELP